MLTYNTMESLPASTSSSIIVWGIHLFCASGGEAFSIASLESTAVSFTHEWAYSAGLTFSSSLSILLLILLSLISVFICG